MDLLNKLSDNLTTYYNATNISSQLLDPSGEVIDSFGPQYNYCSLFRKGCGKYDPCPGNHIHACRESARLGEGYIYSCPAGYTHFAVPVINKNRLVATVLAGPIALGFPDQSRIDDVIREHSISIDVRTDMFRAYSEAPLIEPVRARYLCKLLFSLISNLTQSGSDLERMAERNSQQSNINEYVEMLRIGENSIQTSEYDLEKQIIEDVLTGNKEHARAVLNEVLGRIYFTSGNNVEIIKTRFIELIALLSRAIVENGGNAKDIYQMTDIYLRQMTEKDDLTELSFLLLDILDSFTSMAFSRYKEPVLPALQNAVKYINENYSSTIKLEALAAQVGLNPTYLSTVFKKEMGTTFSAYVTEKRIQQAKHLLKNTNASLADIAMAVGLESQSYFSKLFKKHTGMTPSQYRYSLIES